MIELTDLNGRKISLAERAIVEVCEASPSSQWHGVRAIVRTADRRVLEVQDSYTEIIKQLPNHFPQPFDD